jgi:hypothetical protein
VARGPSLGCGRYRHPSGDTHYVAEGGGRELAYVAMSRAGGPSIVHAVADDLGQAIDDITHDWSFDRNQQWISRTARPGVDPTIGAVPSDPKSTRAHLVAELATLDRVGPPAVGADLAAAHEDSTGTAEPAATSTTGPGGGSTPQPAGLPTNSPRRATSAELPSTGRECRWGDVNGAAGSAWLESRRQPSCVLKRTGARTRSPWPTDSTAGSS